MGPPVSRASPHGVSVFVDAHVHVHDCFPLGSFLEHAHANFRAAADGAGVDSPSICVLMLAETSRDDAFGRLREASRSGRMPDGAGYWTVRPTGEPTSLCAVKGDREVLLVAGRQVATREDLEVLLLCTEHRVQDGLPIRRVLDLGSEHGALRVIPWGAGKWFFSRGRLLSEILRSERRESFCLGDEGGRPRFWPTPRHFHEAGSLQIRVLPGTDPLPFPREVGRAGSYGFRVGAALDLAAPAAGIRALLADPKLRIEPYGSREHLLGFLRNQAAMQIRKRAQA